MTLSIVRSESPPPPALFGRTAELLFLGHAGASAESGAGSMVVLRSESGGGLTRLLAVHAAESAARTVVRLRADPMGTGIPYATLGGSVRPGVDGLTTPADVAEDLLRDWACSGPTLVVIDDLQYADGHTVQTLRLLAGRLSRVPVSVVVAGHAGFADRGFDALADVVAVHDVAPLNPDAVEAMVADLTGGVPDPALLGRCADALGNPWLISRLVESGWPTERFIRTVVSRLERLGEPAGTVLRLAAVLVGSTDAAEIAVAAGLPLARVLPVVDRLCRARLLTRLDDRVQPRHPLVGAALLAASGTLFAPVARSLEAAGAAPDRVAAHLAAAPVLDRWAVAWTVDHAPVTDPDLLGRACAAMEPGDDRQGEARVAWAESLLRVGRTGAAGAAAGAMLHVRPTPPLRSRLRSVLAQVAMARNDGPGALAVLTEEASAGHRPRAMAAQARLLAGDVDGALLAAGEPADGDPLTEVWLAQVEVVAAYLTRDLDRAVALLDRVDALLEIAVADPPQWLLAKLMRAAICDLRDDWAAGAALLAEALPVAEPVDGFFAPWAHLIAALMAYNRGDWAAALSSVDQGLARRDHYGFTRPLHALAGVVLLHRGDVPAGRAHVEAAARAVDQVRGVAAFYEHIAAVGDVLLADVDGRDADALELVRRVADGSVGPHHGNSVSGVAGRLVRVAVRGGDLDLATAIADAAAESGVDGVVPRYCRGLIESDVDALLAAVGGFADAGLPLAAARAGEDAAVLLARAGRVAEAKAAFSDSIRTYTALAALADVDRARAALRASGLVRGVTGKRTTAKRGWDSLTPTELRIAELVAQGCTNPEVARRLVVSPRTVQTHVSRILAKLGLSSRVEIAVGLRGRQAVDGNGVG